MGDFAYDIHNADDASLGRKADQSALPLPGDVIEVVGGDGNVRALTVLHRRFATYGIVVVVDDVPVQVDPN